MRLRAQYMIGGPLDLKKYETARMDCTVTYAKVKRLTLEDLKDPNYMEYPDVDRHVYRLELTTKVGDGTLAGIYIYHGLE